MKKRRWLKGLRWLGLGLLSFIVLLLLGVVAVIAWPQILINERTVNWGASMARKNGVDVAWKKTRVEVRSDSFLKKRFRFVFEGFCSKVGADACFDRIDAAFAVNLGAFPPRLTEVGPLEALGGVVKVSTAEEAEAKKEEERLKKRKSSSWDLPVWLEDAQLKSVHVELNRWEVAMEGGKLQGALDIRNRDKFAWVADVREVQGGLPDLKSAGLRLEVESRTGKLEGPWNLEARGDVALKSGPNARARLEVEQTGAQSLRYVLKADARESSRKAARAANARLSGELNPGLLRLNIEADATRVAPYVPKVSVKECALSLTRLNAERNRGKFEAQCPITAALKFPPVEQIPKFKFPTSSTVHLKSELETPFMPDPDAPIAGWVHAEADPILTPLFEGEGNVRTELAGVPKEFPKDWKLDSVMDVKMLLPEFGRVTELLADTAWAVPAPINVLKGSVAMGAQGKVDLQGGQVPLTFKTRLGSRHQKLDLDGDVMVKVFRKEGDSQEEPPQSGSIDGRLVLTDVKLELPRLDMKKPPRFFPDARLEGKETEPAPSKWTYRFEVVTPPENPARLLSNLAKSPVPVNLNFVMEGSDSMRGSVRVANFPVKAFKRDAQVERFNVNFRTHPDTEELIGDLDSSIRVNYADYVVRVLMFGTIAKPRVQLISDPPVPERQLVAVLLFGRPLDELDPDQTESVGSTQAALADGAIGLASMFALASTPIESVGYDPNSGMFSAKVRLGAGTSLNVGAAEGDLAALGIRKRLSKYWTITTDFAHPTDQAGRSASAFLEWTNRY